MITAAGLAFGHGATEFPMSRVFGCYLSSNGSAACKAAVALGGEQAVYDWNGVNIGNAAGRHRELISDGKLCSANREQHKGFDLARGDWPATAMTADQTVQFSYRATAPHATSYFRFYVTRDGYDPAQPLRWSDLDAAPFCEVSSVTLVNGRYPISCRTPRKSGRHLIYTIWQRSDSPEAFYSCSDVQFGGTPPAAPAWKQIGAITAVEALPAASTVTLRVFDTTGRDLESHVVTLAPGQTAASDWPYALASFVNGRSTLIKAGVLGSNGAISPVKDASRNLIYSQTDGLRTAVDIKKPDTTPPPPPGTVNYVWPAGIGGYKDGTIVRGPDGNIYKCRPAPFTAWCNRSDPQGVTAYAPGTGFAWREAWTFVAAGSPPPLPTAVLVYPSGKESYGPGTVVKGKDGRGYQCRPFPNSGWCGGSELYYGPGTGIAWQDAWIRLD